MNFSVIRMGSNLFPFFYGKFLVFVEENVKFVDFPNFRKANDLYQVDQKIFNIIQ